MADVSKIKLPNGTTYNIKDTVSGYTTNTGTITKVQTTAGAHTTINVSSGAVAFNVPTKTSHLTNDSGFLTSHQTLYEANLQWGGKDFSANYSPIDAAMIDVLGANRFAFLKTAGLTIEYSTDGGSSWVDYGADNAAKVGLFSSGSSFWLGKHTTNGSSTLNDQLRVTISTSAAGIYTVLNKIAIYMSTQGNTVQVKIEKALESTPTTYSVHKDWTGISGWSGWNILNISGLVTYGNTASSQYGRVRFTFRQTAITSTYSAAIITKIMGFGGVGWAVPSTMAASGHLYSYDSSQNATFPAKVTASGGFSGDLTGNVTGTATNASKVNNHTVNSDVPSGAKFTDTVTTATTTGSGNAVTAITASNGALTVTKGATFLTSHQDISGKADKSATVSTVAYDSTNKKITKTINGTTTDVVTVATLKTALGSMPASDVYSWAKASSKPTYTASEVGAQSTLVSGTNIKTINNQSLLGSGDISISGDVSDVQVDGTSIVNQQGVANINPAIFLDFFYRVGSYYETSDGDFDPNDVWGGTWVLETSGLVHVSGDTGDANYPVSGTFTDANGGKGQKQDGNKDAIIPYHRHNVAEKATGGPSNNTSGGQSQGHTHSPSNATNFMYYDSDVSGANVGRRNIGSGSGSYYTWTAAKTDALKASAATSGASQGHTHSLQNHTHTLGQHYTDYEGTNGNRTNANMQPYINVYRWHRIA